MNWALAPLSLIYGGAVRARLWGYKHGWARVHSLGRPVISVGNLTAGGTGKTPLVIAIGEALLARGVGVTVLSRGYRGRAERAGAMASDGQGSAAPAWEEVGDEPALIAGRLPGAAVIVGANRVAAWRRFAAALPAGVVILDDGFQHLAIAREENLVLWDATEPVDRSALLPSGRLREPWSALSRATAVVITRVEQAEASAVEAAARRVREQRKDLPLFFARFEPRCVVEVATGKTEPLGRLDAVRVLAAAGVGRFESFTALLTRSGARVVDAIQFPDHHRYQREDVDRAIGRARRAEADLIATTEKDAVKLERLVRPGESVWAVRLDVRIEPQAPWDAMLDRLARRIAAPG